MEYTCEYCDKIFSTQSGLNKHIKTAKYCLELRGESTQGNYICYICGKDFLVKTVMETHVDTCELEREKLVKNKTFKKVVSIKNEQEDKIKILEKRVKLLESKNLELKTTIKTKEKNQNEKYAILLEKYELVLQKLNEPKIKITGIEFEHIHLLSDEETLKNIIDEKYSELTYEGGRDSLIHFVIRNLLTNKIGNIKYRNCTFTDMSRKNTFCFLESKKNGGIWEPDKEFYYIYKILDMMAAKTEEYTMKMNTKLHVTTQQELYSFHIALMCKSKGLNGIVHEILGKLYW